MFKHIYACATTILLLVTFAHSVAAQSLPPTILQVDLENKVQYHEDIPLDLSKFATDPGITAINRTKDFGNFVSIADIVAVNGQPMKGVALYNTRTVNLRPAPAAGDAISDITRNGVIDQYFEIAKPDGTPVGTILASGLAAGAAPPGSPADVIQGNLAIFGGTGAFLGARGQVGQGATTTADRLASMNEDPSRRRVNGGGKVRIIIYVIPNARPEIVSNGSGAPLVWHASDFSAVTANKPATTGEILSVFVNGLGPTTPSLGPGASFPSSPLATVNAPVQVTLGGKQAQVLDAVGFPGTDGYQVNFRVPSDAPKGLDSLQVGSAWTVSSEVKITVQ